MLAVETHCFMDNFKSYVPPSCFHMQPQESFEHFLLVLYMLGDPQMTSGRSITQINLLN